MSHTIRPIAESDAPAMAELFNYFVLHTFAAYPSKAEGFNLYQRLKSAAGDYPFYGIDGENGKLIGFALLRAFRQTDTMMHTAEITIFFSPENTHKGIGSEVLRILENDARALGISILMATASSRNEPSLSFQRRHGFVECGRFKNVVHKFGEEFDMVWMQKFL